MPLLKEILQKPIAHLIPVILIKWLVVVHIAPARGFTDHRHFDLVGHVQIKAAHIVWRQGAVVEKVMMHAVGK